MAEEKDLEEEIQNILRHANLLRLRGQLREALEKCQEALNLEADNAVAYELMGDILEAQGKLSEAMENYKRSFGINPKNAKLEAKIARLSLKVAVRKGEKMEGEAKIPKVEEALQELKEVAPELAGVVPNQEELKKEAEKPVISRTLWIVVAIVLALLGIITLWVFLGLLSMSR